MSAMKRLFCAQTKLQNASFLAGCFSFIAQCALTMMIYDTSFFFFLITFSLCYHVMLWYGSKKQKISFLLPYLVCQIVCSAYLTAELLELIAIISTDDPNKVGCFLIDTRYNDGCDHMILMTYADYNIEFHNNSDKGTASTTPSQHVPSCMECYPSFKKDAQFSIACLVMVLIVLILTWNIVLRFVLYLRTNNIRNLQNTSRVSYFNHMISLADLDAPLPRPANAPPVYTEKATPISASSLSAASEVGSVVTFIPPVNRAMRTNSLPAYDSATTSQPTLQTQPVFSPFSEPCTLANSGVPFDPTTEAPDLLILTPEARPTDSDLAQMSSVDLSDTPQDTAIVVSTPTANDNHSTNPFL